MEQDKALKEVARGFVSVMCGRQYPSDNCCDDEHRMFSAERLYLTYIAGAAYMLERMRCGKCKYYEYAECIHFESCSIKHPNEDFGCRLWEGKE